jgi:hypothetical protein
MSTPKTGGSGGGGGGNIGSGDGATLRRHRRLNSSPLADTGDPNNLMSASGLHNVLVAKVAPSLTTIVTAPVVPSSPFCSSPKSELNLIDQHDATRGTEGNAQTSTSSATQ